MKLLTASHSTVFAEQGGHINDFLSYVAEHGKSYDSVDELHDRFAHWNAIHAEIQSFNADPNNTHTIGHNKFSDMTEEEKSKYRGAKIPH